MGPQALPQGLPPTLWGKQDPSDFWEPGLHVGWASSRLRPAGQGSRAGKSMQASRWGPGPHGQPPALPSPSCCCPRTEHIPPGHPPQQSFCKSIFLRFFSFLNQICHTTPGS